ncbi:MAG: magnesium-translocating P-type ATPase, partial [Kiritimatiellaeota bacterium]|nr:magnesium-translocating P-type ATPase [Kiritimatiellota bacterium]
MKSTRATREMENQRRNENMARVLALARCGAGEVATLCSMPDGLDEAAVEERREEFGPNKITRQNRASLPKRLLKAFIDPFTSILLILACVSFTTDVLLAEAAEKSFMTPLIVLTMVLVSGILRFIHETRSGNAAARLSEMVTTTASVERPWPLDDDELEAVEELEKKEREEREERGEGEEADAPARPRVKVERREIPLEEIVPGDRVLLSAGDMIPADARIIHAKDFFVSQAALTGESEPQEKTTAALPDAREPLECANLAFMGSNVVSGSAVAIVLATGNDTFFGAVAKSLEAPPAQTSFQKGMNSVSWVLIRFMLVMVPVVFFLNGVTKGDWLESFLFAITVAVGLTPEMLPMIVTTCLAKGAVAMSQKKTIIKHLNSIQNFGAMNVLCTDKTGTLTQDRVVLELHLDVDGKTEPRVLYHGFLNSHYQTGLKNLVDIAVMAKAREEIGGEAELKKFTALYEKVDEIPFDFERRRMSVVVCNKQGARHLITKGAVEEMLEVCAFVERDGGTAPLADETRAEVLRMVDRLNNDGMRVIAVAKKDDPAPAGAFSVADEADMTLIGFLALLDPPKETTAPALAALREYGVVTKVLTGDNDLVTRCICRQVGLEVDSLLLGSDVEAMDDAALAKAVETTNVFAKLSPQQKARIVTAIRGNGNVVGYMGDGINDAGAMKAADVGISVDTAVDIAKESADIILLEKDLMVLENG